MPLPFALAGGAIASNVGLGLLSGAASSVASHVVDNKLEGGDEKKSLEDKSSLQPNELPPKAEY